MTASQTVRMRESGRIVRRVLEGIRSGVGPGMRTSDLDRMARDIIRAEKGRPSFLGYRGYPAAVCVSLNSVVVHGIPGDLEIAEGDLVSIDVGVVKDGFHGDAADTFFAGGTASSPEASRLVDVTYRALAEGIEAARPGNTTGDIGSAVQGVVEACGYSVVRDLVGHGIGRRLHEDPQVPNFGIPGRGVPLKAGMALAIEPMVNAGDWRVRTLDDGWTVVTADGSLSAHAEHTVIVTDGEALVLTE